MYLFLTKNKWICGSQLSGSSAQRQHPLSGSPAQRQPPLSGSPAPPAPSLGARGRASPGGLERQLAGLQLHESAALAQRQLLRGRPVDVVHQVQGPQAALRRGQGARQQLLDEEHGVRAVAAPVQHQAWGRGGAGTQTLDQGRRLPQDSHRPLPRESRRV